MGQLLHSLSIRKNKEQLKARPCLQVRTLYWTYHSKGKMRFYGLSEARVRRVLHSPKRIERGVAEKTEACMQPAGNGKTEIWVMYQDVASKRKVISAWRYPGISKPKSESLMSILRSELNDFVSEEEEKDEKREVAIKKFSRTKWFRKKE